MSFTIKIPNPVQTVDQFIMLVAAFQYYFL